MRVPIDAVHYGKIDLYNLPINRGVIRNLLVHGEAVDVDTLYAGLRPPTDGVGPAQRALGRALVVHRRWRSRRNVNQMHAAASKQGGLA